VRRNREYQITHQLGRGYAELFDLRTNAAA
jgi:hypothetical protein